MIGVDVFSGIGGMSLGVLMAGIDVKFAVENDKHTAETFLANHKDVAMLNDDIQNLHTIPLKKLRILQFSLEDHLVKVFLIRIKEQKIKITKKIGCFKNLFV